MLIVRLAWKPMRRGNSKLYDKMNKTDKRRVTSRPLSCSEKYINESSRPPTHADYANVHGTDEPTGNARSKSELS